MSDARLLLLERELERRRAELAAVLADVPVAARETVPAAGGWSVAMVLEHLAQTEQDVARLLGALAGKASPRDAEDGGLDAFAKHVDMPRFLDRSRKIRGAQPAGTMSAADAWAALAESRRALLAALGSAAGRRLEDVSREHPAGFSLDGYRWIAFVALHEARHAAQIREVAAAVLGSAPTERPGTLREGR